MPSIRANGVDLHVQRLGPRPDSAVPPMGTVVLIHGLFIDSLASYYLTLAPAFAAAGFETVMYDLRGHGRSERPPSGYALEDFTADLEALLDALDLAGRPIHLLGNSFGGTLALHYAVHRPDNVASVAAIEAGPAGEKWRQTMTGLMSQAAHVTGEKNEHEALAWFLDGYRKDGGNQIGEAHVARLASSAGRIISSTTITEDLPASRPVTDEQVRGLRCPVLLVIGSDGPYIGHVPRLKSLLPHSRMVILPGQKHQMLIEAPGKVRELTLEWVRERSAALAQGAEGQ